MSDPLKFNSDAEAFQQKRLFRFRLYFAYGFVLLLFVFLISRMAHLQWYNYERYYGLADGNRISLEALPPTRGYPYSGNHIFLADNHPFYPFSMYRENIDDIHYLY